MSQHLFTLSSFTFPPFHRPNLAFCRCAVLVENPIFDRKRSAFSLPWFIFVFELRIDWAFCLSEFSACLMGASSEAGGRARLHPGMEQRFECFVVVITPYVVEITRNVRRDIFSALRSIGTVGGVVDGGVNKIY